MTNSILLPCLGAVAVFLGAATRAPEDPAAPRVPRTLQEERWAEAEIRKDKRPQVDRIVRTIVQNRARYESVERQTDVDWWAVAVIHNMECSLRFDRHLHNGNPLTRRTYWVPKGRPPTGSPPFTWEESAVDAVLYDRLHRKDWSSLDRLLTNFELYNGAGYLKYHKDVPSPYLWSWTTIYKQGKYVSDGRWSSTAVSKQCGIVPLLRVLEETKQIYLPN